MEQTKRQRQHQIYTKNNNRKSTGNLDRSSRKSVSHFEDLSNELIYEVFEFLDFYHVYDAFFDLNIRFQHLLTHSSLPIHINFSFVSKTAFERCYTNLIIPYHHRIKFLHLSNPVIINRVFPWNITATIFTHLEKLSLSNFDTILLRQVLRHLVSFPHIRSLTIDVIHDVQNRHNFYHDIFSLPRLNYCKVSCKQDILYEPLSFATIMFSPIEYLVIDHPMDLNKVNTLLSYVPQLRHLSFCQLDGSFREQIRWSPIVFNTLTHVSLNVDRLSFHDLESMIRNLFNQVQVLYISVNYDHEYFNANRWERLIVSSMSYLQIFDLFISYGSLSDKNLLRYIALIDQFKSLFWTERQWFFEYQTYKHIFNNNIFLYSTKPYRRKHFTLYGGQRGNFDASDEKTNLDSVHYVDIRNEQAMITSRNYFPNATEVTISGASIDRNGHWILSSVNSIIPLGQLTKLNIASIYCSFSEIIRLLSCAPNIHTLDIYFDFDYSELVLLQENENFQLVSKTNQIRKLTVLSKHTPRVTKFLLILFPRMEHLAITGSGSNLKQTLPFLLPKMKSYSCRLSSLCINVAQCEIKTLKTLIQSQKLLDDYSIHIQHNIHDKDMYLWW